VSPFAAVDVGSNSIRLLIADVDDCGRIRRVHADREVVRLGAGVFRTGRLNAAAADLACRVLERMASAYEKHAVTSLRAVGTAALRDAANRSEFVLTASSILGSPLEVIGGLEEARLVQRGVAVQWPHEHERVLIVDVGGGSVQMILSDRERFAAGTSLPLGAVRLTEMFLPDDPPAPADVARLRLHIREQIAAVAEPLARAAVHRVIATSATAGAIVCAVNGIRRSQRQYADRQPATARQVGELLGMLVERDVASRAGVVGVGRRRAEIIVAGVALLDGLMCGLRLRKLHYSTAGVRDGIIADLHAQAIGRSAERPPRGRPIGHRASETEPPGLAGPGGASLALQTRNTNVT
jgi:exopolyphosphatase/guanosine-5'-triphosphate,3'-diphosphate pyrophosphatase